MFNVESARIVAREMGERGPREHPRPKAAAVPPPRRARQLLGHAIEMLSDALRRRHPRRRVRSV